MKNRFLRALALQLRLLLRLVGPGTPLVLATLIAGVHLQEPRFFRQQGLDLAWPFVFGVADLLSGVVVLLAAATPRSPRSLRLARAASSLLFGIIGLFLAVLLGVVLDRLLGAPTPWAQLPALLARNIMLWLPIAILAQSSLFAGSMLARWLAVAAAFALMSWAMPLSLSLAVADKILPSALALAGALVTIIASDH